MLYASCFMKFSYQARTKTGEIQTGTIEASSKDAALQLISGQNLIVTAIESEKETPAYARRIKIFERVTQKEIALFSRQLAIMFSSEVPLVESLRILARQTTNSGFQEKLTEVANDVDGGTPLSRALSRHPKAFSAFYVNMVKSGEVSGKLAEVLDYLANHLEREYEIISKVKSSLYYPIFIIVVMIAAAIIMLVFLIPKLTGILTESNQQLPLVTRVIIGMSDFMQRYIWFLLPMAVGIGFGITRFLNTDQGKRLWDRLSLKLPVVGPLLQKMYLSRFAENLSTLIMGGLPIGSALQVTGDVVGNSIYREIIYGAKEAVKRGESISSVLATHREIPSLVTQMISVGEKTGRLDSILMNVTNFYRREVDVMVEGLVALIEPFIIVILGAGVFVLVAAVLLPIYNLASAF